MRGGQLIFKVVTSELLILKTLFQLFHHIIMSFALRRVSGCPPTHFPREVLTVPPICPRTSPGSWGLNMQTPEGTPIPLFDIAGRMREKLPLSS